MRQSFTTATRTATALTATIAGLAIAQPAAAQTDTSTATEQTAAGTAEGDATRASFCQNAFYSGDSDASGGLSAEEIAQAESGAYESIDANRDGSISREEYSTCLADRFSMSRSGWPATEPTEDQFSLIDADGSGDVTVMEYATASAAARDDWMSGDEEGWAPDAMAPVRQNEERTPDRFNAEAAISFGALDANLDDRLSREEWIDRGEEIALDVSAVNQKFDETDTDSSGGISVEEFDAQAQQQITEALEALANAADNAAADAAEGTGDAAASSEGSDGQEAELPEEFYYYYRRI